MLHSVTPLLGRSTEVRIVDETLAAARAGDGRAIALVGEEGIGRSRLAAEAAARAVGAGMQVLRGRGSHVGPRSPLRPLAEAVLSLLRSVDPPDTARLGPYLSPLGRLVPDWAAVPADPVPDSPVILGEAVLRLASVAGDKGGCLVVIDDLQDADGETLAVVEYLVDNLAGAPVALLCAVRDEPGPALDLVHAMARRHACRIIHPRRLDRDDVRRLVEAQLGERHPVAEAVLQRVWADGAGNPLVTEELARTVAEELRRWDGAPASVLDNAWASIARRGARRVVGRRLALIGEPDRALLSVAAVLGVRFPLDVARAAAGLDAGQAERAAHRAAELHLLQPDVTRPGWYQFAQPYLTHGLLAELSPAGRSEVAARAAAEVEASHPGLPGEWCEMAAELRAGAADRGRAGQLFVEAGRRCLDAASFPAAVRLLERGGQLLAGERDPAGQADLAEHLIRALTATGRIAEADGVVARIRWLDCPLARRAALHVRVAWLGLTAGRYAEARAHLETGRAALGADALAAQRAAIDAAEAHLALESSAPDAVTIAETRARAAAAAVDLGIAAASAAAADATVTCQLWHLLGLTARHRDPDEAVMYFTRMRRVASEHGLTEYRLWAELRLAAEAARLTGDCAALRHAHQELDRVGALALRHRADAVVVLHDVLCGRYGAAAASLHRGMATATDLGLGAARRDLLVVRAVLAAHQGRRRGLGDALRALGDADQLPVRHRHVVHGLAGVFGALLLEDRDRARAELDRARTLAAEAGSGGGWWGAGLLVDALDGRIGLESLRAPANRAATRSRWDRQFVLWAAAVLHGRAGHEERALSAVDSARQLGEVYPMARHLGLRLAAEAAMADRWGDPGAWLRLADDYFHAANLPAVAAACRALLRRVGQPVRQRRAGSVEVPAALRAMGVTVREHDVLLLLAERLGNRQIAERLHISPRTVEKHVASLLDKTGASSRDALRDVAVALRGEPLGRCLERLQR